MGSDDDFTFTLDVARSDAPDLIALLEAGSLSVKTRQVRAIDGDSELTRIVVAGGSHAAIKLVDGLGKLTGSLFSKITGKGKLPPAPTSLVSPNADARCTFEVRRGDMKLSLENVPLSDVRQILDLLDGEKPAE